MQKRYISIAKIFTFAAFTLSQSTFSLASSAKEFFGDEDNGQALNTSFNIPVQFATDVGLLTLTIKNDPLEKSKNYIKPHLMPTAQSFIEMSHTHFLKRLELAVLEEELNSTSMETSSDDDDQVLPTPTASAPSLVQDKGIDAALPAAIRKRLYMENLILPLKYQLYGFNFRDKYALAKSVLTLKWDYTPSKSTDTAADLSKFKNLEQFYGYILACLQEKLATIAEEKNRKRAAALQAQMYM